MFKTIIFDIGGVVTKTDFKAIYSNFAKRVGLPPEFVIAYHKEKVHDLLLGTITLDQFWKDMVDAGADAKLDLPGIWIDEGTKNREVNTELLGIIKELRKKYSVGVLTNLTPTRLILDEKMGLYSHFDYAVLSCKEHLKKPDPAFYLRGLEVASAKPEEAIYVDDKETCTAPATELGIQSILYTYPDNTRLLRDLGRYGIMSEPKNQHVIPKYYLRQFVDPNVPKNFGPCVWIFERESRRGKRQHIRSVLTETDVYTFRGDYSIEKSLAQLESEYAVIFEKKIKNKLPLNPYEHTVFCAFVAAMLQRTMKQKENIENFVNQFVGWAKQLEMVHGAEQKSSIAWEEVKKDAHKLSLVKMVPEITKILSKMNIAFLCTKNKRVSFITSDAPAYLFNSRLQFQRWFSPGLGQRNVEIRLPLSPEISTCFSWVNNFRGYLYISEDTVHDDNRMVYGHSYQYFIANSPKVKRRWFRRFPLDPVFIWRIIKNKTRIKIAELRRHHHVRSK